MYEITSCPTVIMSCQPSTNLYALWQLEFGTVLVTHVIFRELPPLWKTGCSLPEKCGDKKLSQGLKVLQLGVIESCETASIWGISHWVSHQFTPKHPVNNGRLCKFAQAGKPVIFRVYIGYTIYYYNILYNMSLDRHIGP